MMSRLSACRWLWLVCALLCVGVAIITYTGHSMITALFAPFPFNQDNTAYLLHGQLGQILHSDQIPGRDFISYPAWGPIWVLSLVSRLFAWSPEASQSVNILLQSFVLWGMVVLLLGVILRPILSRRDSILTSLIMASLLMCLPPLTNAPLTNRWDIAAPELTLLSCAFVLVCLPIGLWLLRTRLAFLTGVLWFPCLLWPPAIGGAVAICLLGGMIGRYRWRLFRLLAAILFGVSTSIIGLWLYTDGQIPIWLGRIVALNASQYWNQPPFGPTMRLWDGMDILHHLLTRGGVALGTLLIGGAGLILAPTIPGWRLLLSLHLCFIIAALAQSWQSHPETILWHAADYTALACGLRLVAQLVAPWVKQRGIWLARPFMLGAGLWMGIIILPILPAQFNSSTAIERGRCVIRQECGKPIADRTAAFIEAQRTWFMIGRQNSPYDRIITAWPTWINAMLAIKSDLPTIWAHHAVRGLRGPWLEALENRPWGLSVTESPGIFQHQPWMIHQLWWFYRQIVRQMVPVENDYRYVFWMRRNQGGVFSPAPAECFITQGLDQSQIIVPAPWQQNMPQDQDTVYEIRLKWAVPTPPERFLVVADKPGLFTKTGGFALDPTTNSAMIPLRDLNDVTVLRAFGKNTVPIAITECHIWQINAPDARAALWGD